MTGELSQGQRAILETLDGGSTLLIRIGPGYALSSETETHVVNTQAAQSLIRRGFVSALFESVNNAGYDITDAGREALNRDS